MDNENNHNAIESQSFSDIVKNLGITIKVKPTRRHFWELPNGVVMHRFNGANRRVMFVGTLTRDPAKNGNTNAAPHKLYTIDIRHIDGVVEGDNEDNMFQASVYEDTKLVYMVTTTHGRRIAYDAAMAGLHRYVRYCEKRTARRKAGDTYHAPQAAIDAIMANPPIADAADAQASE